jgi:hypothetical protein
MITAVSYDRPPENLCQLGRLCRISLELLGAFFLGSCQPSPLGPPAQAPPRAVTVAQPAPAAAPSARELRSTVPQATTLGQTQIVIHNTFLVQQYVFLDQRPVGVVPPAKEFVFETSPGAHVVLVSDSADGKANPQHIAEVYDPGFAYRYEVVAR